MHTAECVTSRHPDKICDQIADNILDECLAQDPTSRVAIEAIGGHNLIVLIGEVTTNATIDFELTTKEYYHNLLNKDIKVISNIVKQSPDIAQGVNNGGAGDQGIMVGYACNENDDHIPNELFLARRLLKPFKVDAKSQVTLKNDIPTEIVLSVQKKTKEELYTYTTDFLLERGLSKTLIKDMGIYCNNTGAFDIGGFDSDSGCVGRKIVIDTYGPRVPVGGGAFSGKDPTKVDRSAAYMARYMALKYLNGYAAIEYNEVLVTLAYVIGKAEPVMIKVVCDGKDLSSKLSSIKDFDCRPQAIIERFKLRRPIYLDLAKNGHFGRRNLPWEQI